MASDMRSVSPAAAFARLFKGVGVKAPTRELRVGRVMFDRRVRGVASSLYDNGVAGMHETQAVVLMTSTGVGRSFASVTARYGQQQLNNEMQDGGLELVTAYLGFDYCFLLYNELCSTAQEVEQLVARRLLSVMAGLLNTADGNLANLDTEGSVQKCTYAGTRWHDLTRDSKTPLAADDVASVLEQQLAALKAMVPAERRLVVLVTVDKLRVIQDSFADGPRVALRYLRWLQYEMLKRAGVLVLPLGMGTHVDVSLPTAAEGRNTCLGEEGEVMLTREEFRQMGVPLLRERKTPNPHYYDFYLALSYPSVGTFMSSVHCGRWDFCITLGNTVPCKELLYLLVQAAKDGWVERRKIPHAVPCLYNEEGTMARLVPNYESYMLLTERIFRSYDQCDRPWGWGSARRLPESFKLSDIEEYTFEEVALKVLADFIELFGSCLADLEPEGGPDNTRVLRDWVGVGKVPLRLRRVMQVSQLHKPMLGGRVQADTHRYDSGMVLLLMWVGEKKREVGDAALLHCQGGLLEFVLVVLGEGGCLCVRFADTKLGTGAPECADYSMLVGNARKVHRAMEEALGVHGHKLAPFAEDAVLAITPTPPEGCAQGNVLHKGNFKWEPLSSMLFSVPRVQA